MKIPDLNIEEKDKFIEFLLRQYRLVDAFWFLKVEEKFGTNVAVKLNEEIWEEIGKRSAKDIINRFKIGEKGLKGFIKAIKLFPWTLISEYCIESYEDKVIIKVPRCPPQEARVKMGLGEFPCKEMHVREFSGFAKVIDEKLEVNCVFAPPDKHPENCWCLWEIKLKE